MNFSSLRHTLYRRAEKFFFKILVARKRRTHIAIEFKNDLQLIGMPRLKLAKHSSLNIGTRNIVLKGVTIGDNTVIGAGSVVIHSIPPNSVAGGNPCTVRGQLPNAHAQ